MAQGACVVEVRRSRGGFGFGQNAAQLRPLGPQLELTQIAIVFGTRPYLRVARAAPRRSRAWLRALGGAGLRPCGRPPCAESPAGAAARLSRGLRAGSCAGAGDGGVHDRQRVRLRRPGCTSVTWQGRQRGASLR